MSPKIHFLGSHLEFFSEKLSEVSDKHVERFHQDILAMEKRYIPRQMDLKYVGRLLLDTERDVPEPKY